MFTWVMDWVRNQQIARDFQETQAALRLAHQREAQPRFATRDLERQVADV